MSSIVKLTTYLVDRLDLAACRDARDAALGDHKPASTLLFVSGFVSPEVRVEIDIVAARDATEMHDHQSERGRAP